MVEMSKICLPVLLASALFAQNAPDTTGDAPPEVDAALRARVNQFFQYEVEGKFRQAEALVAEKDKDFFVAANKPTYRDFSIKSITYSDQLTKATVLVNVSRLVPVPGFEGHPVPGVIPSRWKLENGAWCWYVEPRDLAASPMGLPPGGMPLPGGGIPQMGGMAAPGSSSLPPIPNMMAAVRPDKSTLELKSSAPSSGQITFLNPLRAAVTLSVMSPPVPGLEVKLEHPDLKTGESAVLHVESKGGSPPSEPVTIKILVRQTNQLIPIKVAFTK